MMQRTPFLLFLFGWLVTGCTSVVDGDAEVRSDRKDRIATQGDALVCPSTGSCQSSTCNGGRATGTQCTTGWQCKLHEPCDTVHFLQDDLDGSLTLSTPSAAQCVLQALRDGKQGTMTWHVSSKQTPGGQFFTDGTLHIRPNRVALESVRVGADLLQSQELLGPTVLQEPSYFEACLLKTAAEEVHDCLENALQSCSP